MNAPEIVPLYRPKNNNNNDSASDSQGTPTHTSDMKKDDTFDDDFPELKQIYK